MVQYQEPAVLPSLEVIRNIQNEPDGICYKDDNFSYTGKV
jgi:hypothetical protein